jgi:uncharacterized protein
MTGFRPAGAVRAALAFFLLLAFAGAAQADPAFPERTGRVVDGAHILPAPAQAALTQKLAALEKANGDLFVVVTLQSLQGLDIAEYANELGRRWGLGGAAPHASVLLLVAPNERQARLQMDPRLTAVLTDAASSSIIQGEMVPRFRQGDFPGGVGAAVDAIIRQISAAPSAAKPEPSQ